MVLTLQPYTDITVWHDAEYSFLWVWVSASQKIPLFVLMFCMRDFSWDQRRTREGRSQSQEQRMRRERAVNRSQGKSTARNYGPRRWVGQHKMSQHFWWLCGIFPRIHAHNSSQNAGKVSQTSPFLHLELTQVRVCLFVLFSSTHSVVYVVFCVSVKKCEIPLDRDERNQ